MDAALTGRRILTLRKELGWTQKELAEKLHVTDKAVSKWENGLNFPDIALMEPLAEVLGTTVLSLLGLEKAEENTIVQTITDISIAETIRLKRTIRTWITFIGLIVIILCLSIWVMGYATNHQLAKEIFINESYFLLKDIAEEIDMLASGDDTMPSSLQSALVELDVRCIIQTQRTNGNFRYIRPGVFEMIARNLETAAYSSSQLEALAKDLQQVIDEMSDKSGIAENSTLSYKELNNIFQTFEKKWCR